MALVLPNTIPLGASDDTSSATRYTADIRLFVETDEKRNGMIRNMAAEIEGLRTEKKGLKADYDSEKRSRRTWQNQAECFDTLFRELRLQLDSHQTVLVILDGDGAIFLSEFYQQGHDGGVDAAHKLGAWLREDLKSRYPDCNTAHWQLHVHMFLHARGLGGKLVDCQITTTVEHLMRFGHGWTSHPLSYFTDVGPGKENADRKIRQLFESQIRSPACKHVFFGPCSDTGYINDLRTYKANPELASKITLIETRPAAASFHGLGFPVIRAPSLFRSSNLPDQLDTSPVISPILPVTTHATIGGPGPSLPDDSHARPGERSQSTWAGMASQPTTANQVVGTTSYRTNTQAFILVNASDQRLDIELDRPDRLAEQRLNQRIQARKLCNDFHLRGRCKVPGAYNCGYLHGDQLPEAELLVLKHRVRGFPCTNGELCQDSACIYGHRCKNGRSCGHGDSCRFAQFHGMDLVAAKKIFDDGSSALLVAPA